MTCELIILEKRTGKSWDIAPQVQKVTYTTNRTGSPGTLKFTVNASGISFLEGDTVRFSAGGQVIFLGWVFTKSRDRYGIIDVTCYDQLRYLKASASYCFVGRTAGDPQRPCPYHITAPDGAAKGWVARGQLQAVDR